MKSFSLVIGVALHIPTKWSQFLNLQWTFHSCTNLSHGFDFTHSTVAPLRLILILTCDIYYLTQVMEGVTFAMRSSRDALASGQSLSTGIRAYISTFPSKTLVSWRILCSHNLALSKILYYHHGLLKMVIALQVLHYAWLEVEQGLLSLDPLISLISIMQAVCLLVIYRKRFASSGKIKECVWRLIVCTIIVCFVPCACYLAYFLVFVESLSCLKNSLLLCRSPVWPGIIAGIFGQTVEVLADAQVHFLTLSKWK